MLSRMIEITCSDGVVLKGHHWLAAAPNPLGRVIINGATGVLARYYHHYARFLSAHGYEAITYDYSGIGLSRREKLSGHRADWRLWGERDFDAVLTHARALDPQLPILVVGHSIGGVLPGFAAGAPAIARMLTVGAQHAYWRDYMPSRKMRLLMKWHVAMPVLTGLFGYFPGRRLDWLEDLPAGVAFQWSFGGPAIDSRLPADERPQVQARFAAVRAPILAIGVTDDEFGTRAAIRRALGPFSGADRTMVMLSPADLACDGIGHFDLFHARHAHGFWLDTLLWLRDGVNPWPRNRFA
jgi:predicted alpha/beta hydrolase